MAVISPARTVTRLAAFIFAVLLAVVSLIPAEADALGGATHRVPPLLQNILHVPAYAVLCVLAVGSLSATGRSRRPGVLITALGCVAFGGALEVAQCFVPGRFGSVADALLNAAGVALGVAGMGLWLARRAAPHTPTGPEAMPVKTDGGGGSR